MFSQTIKTFKKHLKIDTKVLPKTPTNNQSTKAN
jgi:hypothetical protein